MCGGIYQQNPKPFACNSWNDKKIGCAAPLLFLWPCLCRSQSRHGIRSCFMNQSSIRFCKAEVSAVACWLLRDSSWYSIRRVLCFVADGVSAESTSLLFPFVSVTIPLSFLLRARGDCRSREVAAGSACRRCSLCRVILSFFSSAVRLVGCLSTNPLRVPV